MAIDILDFVLQGLQYNGEENDSYTLYEKIAID